MQVRCTAKPREKDPQPRGLKGRLYPPLSFQHLVQFNLPNVPYGARLLEPQVGELSWDRAPPEVVDDAGDKQPGKTKEGQQQDERNQHTSNSIYINYVSIFFNPPGNTWKVIFTCSLVSAVKLKLSCVLDSVWVPSRDVRGGAFSSGAGRGQKSAGRGEGENPRGGAKKCVNRLIQKFDKSAKIVLGSSLQ